jgi:hypothetical protein
MSALPPKADMAQHDRDVRFVPKATYTPQQKAFRIGESREAMGIVTEGKTNLSFR